MINNPNSENELKLINHFPGGVGNFGSKREKMANFFTQYFIETWRAQPFFKVKAPIRFLWLHDLLSINGCLEITKLELVQSEFSVDGVFEKRLASDKSSISERVCFLHFYGYEHFVILDELAGYGMSLRLQDFNISTIKKIS